MLTNTSRQLTLIISQPLNCNPSNECCFWWTRQLWPTFFDLFPVLFIKNNSENMTGVMALNKYALKGKNPESGGARREITCWHQAEESDAEGGGFLCLMPASDLPTRTNRKAGVFLLYRIYLWNKQQVMSINLTTWSTMQYHVVVDNVVFYVRHSQVRYNY